MGSHNRANLSAWEVTNEGSLKLHKHMHCRVTGKPTSEEQTGKNRVGKKVYVSPLSFTWIASEARAAGKFLQGNLQEPLKDMSKL